MISFHSLEDRIVKRFIKTQSSAPQMPRGLPIMESEFDKPIFKSVGKAIKPSKDEVQFNVRSRSAIMRIGEKQ